MGNPVKDLGPCAVVYNSEDLGATMGGVSFRYTEESKPVNEDQKGVTEVDGIKVGVSACEVTVPLSRSSLAILAKVVKGATRGGDNLLQVKNHVGVSMYDNAAALILKPIVANVASTDNTTWLTASKAYPRADFDIAFNNEGQRVYNVIFKVFPDAVTGELWRIGA